MPAVSFLSVSFKSPSFHLTHANWLFFFPYQTLLSPSLSLHTLYYMLRQINGENSHSSTVLFHGELIRELAETH